MDPYNLRCRVDPGMRIRSRRTAKIMMTRGSGSADPGVRTVIKFSMTRGSGGADPGVRTVVKIFYDDARIRECGSGR